MHETKYVVKRVLTTAEAAYLAGIVDGEGTLSVWRSRPHDYRSRDKYAMTFTIAQADWPFLDGIRQMAGNGHVAACRRKQPDPRRKPEYKLVFNGHQTRWILPQISPYLRVKRRQADLVLQFLGAGVGDKERARIYGECHALNQKGPAAIPINRPEALPGALAS